MGMGGALVTVAMGMHEVQPCIFCRYNIIVDQRQMSPLGKSPAFQLTDESMTFWRRSMNELVDGWVDGREDGCMDGRIHGWMDR